MLKKCDIRLKDHLPHNKINKYGHDQSGKITYEFNSLGYRGEDYNPKAKKLIYVAGCSHTFGTGLELEDTWPYQFKELFIKKEQLNSDDCNLMNFAVGAHSNDYISRILMTQSRLIKPDMIIVYFTAKERTEYVSEYSVKEIGPWQINENTALPEAISYYDYYTDELGHINMLKNILLLQYFCKHNNIDYIFSCVANPFDKKFISNPICSQFIELIDREYFCDFKLHRIDSAADAKRNIFGRLKKGHAGPKSNRLFAEKIFKFYEKRIASKSNQ